MKNSVKAAVFMGAHTPFVIKDFPVCETPKGYGRSELIASGVCGTDLHFYRGTLAVGTPSIIGHEFVGRLTDADPDEAAKYGLKVGDNVIADIAVPCGKCPLCLAGDEANCVNMGVTNGGSIDEKPYLWGGYTEVNFTPLTNLVKIPEALDPAAVAAFACPGPTAIHAFKLASRAGENLKKANVAVVQGLGPVGCFAALYLKSIGIKKVYAVAYNISEEKMKRYETLGLDGIFDLKVLGSETVTRTLAAENNGLGVDVVFEASGSTAAVPLGMNILRNRGLYLVPGQYSNSGGVEIQPQLITFKALHIIGSSQYDLDDVSAYLNFLCEYPQIQTVIKNISMAYPVDQVNTAFSDALAGKNVKTLLTRI